MNLKPRRSTRLRSAFSSELYQKVVSEEDAIKFAKIGLMTLRVVTLEKEVADLAERIDQSRKRITELPCEIRRSEKLLAEVIADQKMLESLESGK
jgi:predicted  nucleic acid-binding Zn-ribbon protein